VPIRRTPAGGADRPVGPEAQLAANVAATANPTTHRRGIVMIM
jgi:hypothetical protein